MTGPGSVCRPVVALAMRAETTVGQIVNLVSPEQIERLSQDCAVPSRQRLTTFEGEAAAAILARADILLTGWGCPKLDEHALALAPRLRLVAHAGTSVRPVVTEAVWRRGIVVSAAGAANAVPVAEFTLATILLANKRAFGFQCRYARERAWLRPGPETQGNAGAVVGLVGLGAIGGRVAALLAPFDLSILLHDPFVPAETARAHGVEPVTLDELLTRAAVVSLHAPSLPATRHMIGRRELALLRDDATLINTARGALVDEAALIDELRRRPGLQAVLDVTDPEPPLPDSPLFELPNVFLTPHIAGAFGAETYRLAELMVQEIGRFARGEPLCHEITQPMLASMA